MPKGTMFNNPATSIPRKDSRILKIDFDSSELGARKSHLPKGTKNDAMAIKHVK